MRRRGSKCFKNKIKVAKNLAKIKNETRKNKYRSKNKLKNYLPLSILMCISHKSFAWKIFLNFKPQKTSTGLLLQEIYIT